MIILPKETTANGVPALTIIYEKNPKSAHTSITSDFFSLLGGVLMGHGLLREGGRKVSK